jgi:demethylmenaquinone methyltransferase / 2-methoxy-6-polyprenyl-1,4-benzoquinol methylase
MPVSPSLNHTHRFGRESVSPNERDRRMEELFQRLSPYYDRLLDIQTLGFHRWWRRILVRLARPHAGQCILDLAGGCGEMARRLAAPDRQVVVLDLCLPMLAAGRARGIADVEWVAGRARALPFANASMDSVVCAFGVRNVTDVEKTLQEVLRVLKPGARFSCLESSQPWGPIRPLHDAFCRFLVPRLGDWITRAPDAYEYLVDSLIEFPGPDEVKQLLEEQGFIDVSYRRLALGNVCLHCGRKPALAA